MDKKTAEKLDSILERNEELQSLLADSQVIARRTEYQKYAKELAGISKIANKYKEYKKLSEELQKIKELVHKNDQEKDFLELAEEEFSKLKKDEKHCRQELEEMLYPQPLELDRDIIVEIRAGTGGEEAALFVANLFRMYSRFAQLQGWKVETMDTSPTGIGGLKEIVFSIKGKGVFQKFKYESGTHRVQRVPATEAGGRIHTSAATVYVMPEAKEVDIHIKPEDLRIDVFRSSGSGGQHVNVTDSAVRITHLPTGTVVSCQDERSQYKNKIKAMRVLRARILDKERREQQEKISRQRKLSVGTGDRSQKIRTYNFPGQRVTDHRFGLTLHSLDNILNGDLNELIASLAAGEKELRNEE
ncbi:MAG: peptide chain release factor 1 [Candidatus Omnitrophota bacterium]|nr:peptide chain release factor 1 [Candidatus Omnitrophota bacterium]